MVPLLEPPLLLERGCEEAEDRESPGPVRGFGVGDGDGVRVGDVLLEVEELPDCGLFFNSIFYKGTSVDESLLRGQEEVYQVFLVKLNVRQGAQTLLEWTSEATRLGWEWISGRLISGSVRVGTEGVTGGWLWVCVFSGV